MNDWIIYHNDDCSKSRAALEILEAHNISAKVVNYLITPPNQAEIKTLLQKLGKSVQEIIRKNDAKTLNLINLEQFSEQDLINLICQHPILLERPIIVHGDQAVIARPPENVMTLLNQLSIKLTCKIEI